MMTHLDHDCDRITRRSAFQKISRNGFLIGIAMGLVSLLCLFEPRPSQAASVLRPGSHAGYLLFGLGYGIEMTKLPGQFKINQELGIHFSGRSSGPAIALSLAESFGSDLVIFQVGPKFLWDIQIARRVGFYITPTIQAGYSLLSWSNYFDEHEFNLQVGTELKLLLGNRLLLFLKPFGLDMFVIDQFRMRYDISMGLGVTL